MTFSRAKPLGFVDDVVLPASELNIIDINQSRGLDGTAGGTYTPTASLIIAGAAGLQIGSAGETHNVKLASRSITRQQDMLGYNFAANFTPGARGVWTEVEAGPGGSSMYLSLNRLLHGGTLAAIHVKVDPAGGHGGNVTAPGFAATAVNVDGGAAVALGNGVDVTGGVIAGGYEAAHLISLTGLAHTIDLTQYRYWLEIVGEAGVNYVANCKFTGCYVVVTCAGYSEF